MLAHRFQRRGVNGIRSVGVELRNGRRVARLKLGPDGHEATVRKAAAPVLVEAEQVEAVRTVRLARPATETEPAHRALALVGVALPLAGLSGRLCRAGPKGNCDFLVAETPVRLLPEHRIGPPGGPLVLDGSGDPFAEEGDAVSCVGGFGRTGPVRGETPVFNAGELRVYE
jgi:hypothetical protein